MQTFNLSSLVLVSGQTFKGLVLIGLLDRSNQLVAVESSQHWLEGQSLSEDLVATAEKGLLGFTNFAIKWPPG